VIESKQTEFSLQPGIPQALIYMLSSLRSAQPPYGMVTNGSNFIFLKLIQQGSPRYALSDEFTLLRHNNELYKVLQILKQLAEILKE
jgi:hypothetical protein